MKSRTITYLCLSIVIVLASCKKDKPASVYMGYDYFPNNVGHWVIYNVDSISFNPLNPSGSDTAKYQAEDVIDSFYTDNTGARTQVIRRFKRPIGGNTWTYQKTYTANLTPTEALRTEDGVKYVKLVFPVASNTSWNGGAFSSLPTTYFQWNDTSFQYTSVNTPATVNGTFFDSTLVVLQDSESGLTLRRLYEEEYAVNVGRIYKDIIEIDAPQIILFDPNSGLDSLYVTGDYIPLVKQNLLEQGSTIYTEIYVASGN